MKKQAPKKTEIPAMPTICPKKAKVVDEILKRLDGEPPKEKRPGRRK